MRSPARLLVLAPLALVAFWGLGRTERAEAEDNLFGSVTERDHTVEVVPGIELTTLEVTRTFFNPTFDAQALSLQIDLPCHAILDGLALRGPDDARGREVWVPGKLIDPESADERFWEFRMADGGEAMDGNTMAVLSRSHDCSGNLDLFPVPPLRERSVRYRVQLPSRYGEGRYSLELPAFVLDHAGARMSVADPPDGFEMTLDGSAVTGMVALSGSTDHSLTLTPVDAGHARVSLASIDLQQLGASEDPQSVIAAELDLPKRLVELPPVRRVVVAIDASHSLDATAREHLQRLAATYLHTLEQAQPEATVEVLEFDRHVRRVHGEFVAPRAAVLHLGTTTIASHNGSEPGLALAHARELLAEARQPGEVGVDWVLLLSDLELRDEYSLAAELEAAEASEVRMHVIRPAEGDLSLTPMPTDDPWMLIAEATGGAHFGYAFDESSLASDGAELLEPNRVWDLRLIHTDARRRTSVIPLADELRAGDSELWLERLAAPALDRVSFEAWSWASPLAWSAKSSPRARQRWAGRLTAGDEFELALEEAESKAIAKLAASVTVWTAMIAEARFDGRSELGDLSGWGRGYSSSCGCGFRCGMGHGSRSARPRELDLSVLQAAIAQALEECSGVGSASFEILDREIVAVESSHACAREAIWQLDLRAWPSFGHPLAQVAFDELGVHHLQLTSLDDSQPASLEP